MIDNWWPLANCRGIDPELFHPARGESCEAARAVCAGCVVREECLQHALDNGERLGVWGGLSERERRKLRAARRQRVDRARCGTIAGYAAHRRRGEATCPLCRVAQTTYHRVRYGPQGGRVGAST